MDLARAASITISKVRVPSWEDGIVHGRLYVAKVDVLTLRGPHVRLPRRNSTRIRTIGLRQLSVSTPTSGQGCASLNAFRTLFGVKVVQKNGPFLRRSLTLIVSSGNGGIGLMKGPSFGLLRNNGMQLSSTDAALMRTNNKNFFHELRLETLDHRHEGPRNQPVIVRLRDKLQQTKKNTTRVLYP